MTKLNQNRLGFFALGVIFGGWVLGVVRRFAMVGAHR